MTEPDRTFVQTPPASAWAGLSAQPQVLATSPQFETLRHQIKTDTISQQLVQLILRQADNAVSAEPIAFVDTGSFLLGAIRTTQGRILSTAMMYRLTRDSRYLAAARRELLALADLPDWCPRHFLDVGEAALACGVGLNWLGDALCADERAAVTRAIIEKALNPSLATPDSPGWPTAEHNWNPVCNAGLAVGAIAIAQSDPGIARRVVERAIRNVPHAAATYAPDGTFPEGPSYWSYGTTFYVILIEALRASLGTSCNLESAPGFLGTVNYIHQVVGPSGNDFNYADYHTRSSPEPLMLWFARELQDRSICTAELENLEKITSSISDLSQPVRLGEAHRFLPLELLWWNPALGASDSEAPRCWVGRGALPLAVLRSSWSDPAATYIAIKGGTPNGSHAHMDIGSFVLESDGIRWAVDLGTENYPKMRAAKIDLWNYHQSSSRWSVFRNGPDSHNIIRVEGRRPNSDGFATIPRTDPSESFGAQVNLTSMYAPDASSLTRTVHLSEDKSVTLTDRWTVGSEPLTWTWQWLTFAEVSRIPSGLTLAQSGRSLALSISAPTSAQVYIEDLSAPATAADSANPGLKRVVIRMPTPALTSAELTVRAIPGGANP